MKNLIQSALVIMCCLASSVAFSQALEKQIIGEWRNQYVKIIIHHKDKPPITMEADSSNWEARLQIKPIRTHYKEDGTYYSEYINLKDSIVNKPSGTWSIKGDSLTMIQQMPYKSVYTVHMKINKNIATFNGVIDFDSEGIANDEYWGIQKKFD